jgi:hypothetical protein
MSCCHIEIKYETIILNYNIFPIDVEKLLSRIRYRDEIVGHPPFIYLIY